MLQNDVTTQQRASNVEKLCFTSSFLCWSYCYLFVYYLLLAVLVFYSVFVAIYMTSFAGRYLSFSVNPLSVWQLSSFYAMFTIFPTSRFGWVNLLAACSLLFILVMLCVTPRCSGLVWSLLSCFALCVFSTMYLCLHQGYCY